MGTRRRCSVCSRVGHDRRAHRNLRGRRLNPDWFRDASGRPHPVRSSPGYEDAFVGMGRGDKRYLRQHSDQPRHGYTQESQGRASRAGKRKTGKPGRLAHSVGEHRFRPKAKRTLY